MMAMKLFIGLALCVATAYAGCEGDSVFTCTGIYEVPQNIPATVRSIDMSYNNLGDLPQGSFDGMPKLTKFDASGNQIQKIGLNVFIDESPKLSTIRLNQNAISEINDGAFSRVPNLKVLDLSDNDILEWRAAYLTANTLLETIRLSHNQISNLPGHAFQNCGALTGIYLDDNPIGRINPGLFDDNPLLQILQLQDTAITVIPPAIFAFNTELVSLDIRDNLLTTLPSDMLDNQKKDGTLKLLLNKNDYVCCPDLLWLKDEDNGAQYNMPGKPKCTDGITWETLTNYQCDQLAAAASGKK